MSEICVDNKQDEPDEKSAGTLRQDDVAQQTNACASLISDQPSKLADGEIPPKKRKTRRGKSKRRHPYIKNGSSSSRTKSNKMMKPEAPHNSNQFLLEDHGYIEELDENLKNAEQISTTSGGRTRDSSFSVDSDGEFYSSPDDEEQFLIKDFDDQYESVQAERLQSMSKDELIQEYLMLESKVELLTKRLRKRGQLDDPSETSPSSNGNRIDLQKDIERLTMENDALKREIAVLKTRNINNNKTCSSSSSDSEDSETDSDDSCSSTSSSSSCCSDTTKPTSPNTIDYSQTNGHSAGIESV